MAMTKTMQSMRSDTQMQAGTAMIGKFISGTDSAGNAAAGLVSRVVQNSDGVFVELANKQKVEINSINNVWNDANSMNNDLASSGNVIGMWVEAGYDSAAQPIRGIIQSVNVKDGQVYLQLYGGKAITWDQVQSLRAPTEEEVFLYTFSDEVREKVEKARQMIDFGVSGTDTEGNKVNGIVADAKLVGTDVYLVLYSGEEIKLENVDGEARKPTVSDAQNSLNGLWVEGLGKDGSDITGIVIGAVENDDGVALVLDSGQKVYLDTVTSVRSAKDEDKARLHGMWVGGKDTDGEDAAGIVAAKVEVDGKLAVKLDTGKIILCENLTEVRKSTEEEQNRLK